MVSDRAGHDDDPAGHDPAPRDPAGETEQTTTQRPAYAFHSHFHYGLLREEPPGSLYFEAWCPPDEHGQGLWHTITFDPFTASMSAITKAQARKLIGKGDLYAPADEERYWRETEANALRAGFTKADVARARANA